MLHLRSILRSFAVALTLAVVAAPVVAQADEGRAPAAARHEGKQGGKHEKHFPIAAVKFEKHVDKGLAKQRERLEKRMAAHHVPEAKRAERWKQFDEGAAKIRAEVKRVGADGTVTKEEAQQVRALARPLHKEARTHHKRG
ncbi:hypothetical protein [Polyangium mundeleinium]|uniref:Uncharacterized protein n=1 Tax=Polyangium mundeleinium TaxID=2995306 RepID=A0ABT5EQQ2_9BACT|nr:hypothetical protein [Polyangium mundeleinium]MDC0744166.1 hypothetical protein [Polyangium mundeleinium]